MKSVEPSNRELLKMFLFGLGLLSFGLLFIWIPIFGTIFQVLGGLLAGVAIATFISKKWKI